MGEGLYRFPVVNNFTQLQHAQPLAVFSNETLLRGGQVWRLFEDSHQRIWVSIINSGNNGLVYWDRQTQSWRDLATEANLPSSHDDLAGSFAEDRAGDVWIGFNTGVARLRNGVFAFFTVKDGVPTGAIQNIYLDHAGRLWLASSRGGLIRIDNPGCASPL